MSTKIQIVNILARYASSHTAFPCTEFFNLDGSAQNTSQHDTGFAPDMLIDEGTSTS
jgi:hypothetical protein